MLLHLSTQVAAGLLAACSLSLSLSLSLHPQFAGGDEHHNPLPVSHRVPACQHLAQLSRRLSAVATSQQQQQLDRASRFARICLRYVPLSLCDATAAGAVAPSPGLPAVPTNWFSLSKQLTRFSSGFYVFGIALFPSVCECVCIFCCFSSLHPSLFIPERVQPVCDTKCRLQNLIFALDCAFFSSPASLPASISLWFDFYGFVSFIPTLRHTHTYPYYVTNVVPGWTGSPESSSNMLPNWPSCTEW